MSDTIAGVVAAARAPGSSTEAGAAAGIPASTVRKARQLAKGRPELFSRFEAEEITLGGAMREMHAAVDDGAGLPVPYGSGGTTDLEALCDAAAHDLAEARDIETVWAILDRAEQIKRYARKHRAAVGAQNRCTEFVTLVERRIGEELAKLEKNQGGRPAKTSRKDREVSETSTIPALGLTHDQSAAYQALAAAPEAAIHAAVEKATEEGRAVTKTEIRRAAREASPPKSTKNEDKKRKGGGGPRRGGGSRGRPASPAPTPADTDPTGVRAKVSHASAWIIQGSRVRSMFGGDGGELVRRAAGFGVRFSPDEIETLRDFLEDIRRALDADGAAAGRANADGGGRAAAPAN